MASRQIARGDRIRMDTPHLSPWRSATCLPAFPNLSKARSARACMFAVWVGGQPGNQLLQQLRNSRCTDFEAHLAQSHGQLRDFYNPTATGASDRPSSPVPATGRRTASGPCSSLWAVDPPLRLNSPVSDAGSRRSLRPRPVVLRATPVARDVAATPPWPAVTASAAACNRRPRSFSDGRADW